MFKILLGFTALLIAGCAAFFSVRGIATLFSGAFLAVIIMAGSLELGKLVATTFLHRYWSKTSTLLKTYLLTAVFALILASLKLQQRLECRLQIQGCCEFPF